MKKIQSKATCLRTLLFTAWALLLIPSTNLSAAPTVFQGSSTPNNFECNTPTGIIINNCGPAIFLLDKQPADPLAEAEQVYLADSGVSFSGSIDTSNACVTAPVGFGAPPLDQGITSVSYMAVTTDQLLSSLDYAAGAESVSQTMSVRENDLTTTPTVCTRKDDTDPDTYYMTVFPPLLTFDVATGLYEPANTLIPTTPVEVDCSGSRTYGDCEAEALTKYTQSYGIMDAVPLLVGTTPADNDDAVDPATMTFTMTFDQAMASGAMGQGYLKRSSDDFPIEIFSAGSGNLSLDPTKTILTITRSVPLDEGTDYYIDIEIGAIESDITGNAYPGITFNNTWNFRTNSYPALESASVTGVPAVLSTLTATPVGFTDIDGDTAGMHTYKWFSGIPNDCSSAQEILGETASTYSLVAADVGNFVCVVITPKDIHGLEGEPVFAVTSLAIVKAPQTIIFNDPLDVVYSPNLAFPAVATSNSGLAVDIAVDLTTSSPGVCTVAAGTNIVTVVSAGNCDLVANQAGDVSYNPSASKFQTVVISQAAQTVSFADPSDVIYSPSLTFPVSASSGSTLPVAVGSATTDVCTVSGGIVTVLSTGNCDLVTTQLGDINYTAAAAVSQRVVISQALQIITFVDPADVTYSPGLTFSAPASSTSSLPVTVGSTSTGVCTISGSTVTVLSGGVCSLVASQSGDTNYQAASAVPQTVTIAQAIQAVIFADPADFSGAVGATFSVPVSTDSGLAVTLASSTSTVCTASGTTVTVVGPGTCSLTAAQAGNASYSAATTVNRSVIISTTVDVTGVTETGGGGGSVALMDLLLGFGLASLLYRRRLMLSLTTTALRGGK